MTELRINREKVLGKIKPMHGVGQPPIIGVSTEKFHFLKEANIPYSRLHDVGDWFGGNLFVDIPNVFRDFEADENDPASYDFTFTDIIIKDLIENGCEPIYRLGVTIENFHMIKSYRIYPPKDMAKWARICEHVIRHYNYGWADGYNYNIKYWEIWNEPEGHPVPQKNGMWNATKEEYFELYRITSKHLRKCFGNEIKIGGYASCGFYKELEIQIGLGAAFGTDGPLTDWQQRTLYFEQFFFEFIKMVKEENLPFDFFSYHSYSQPDQNKIMQAFCEKNLEEVGLGDVEIHLNEWNPNPYREERGTSRACAAAVANLLAMQNTKMTLMCYYDARIGISAYSGLFNPLTFEPFCTYYGFKAFGKLYSLGTQIECVCEGNELYSLAAMNEENTAILISNLGEDTDIKFDTNEKFKAYLIDEKNTFSLLDTFDNSFKIKKNQVIYIEM